VQLIKQDLPIRLKSSSASGTQTKWDETNSAVETFSANVKPVFLFLELPDNRWQCPHWGFMLKGQIRVQYTDREEVITAGDLYYLPAGQAILIEEETEVIEFSPKGNYKATLHVTSK
jgi:hypothetical protein